MQTQTINAQLVWGNCGQDHAYGDIHRRCEIHTTQQLSDKDILNLVGERNKMPKEKFDKGVSSPSEYFLGYYTIEKMPYGYFYHGVEPYDD